MQLVVSLSRDYLTDCQDGSVDRPTAPAILVGARRHYELINTADLDELVGVVIEPGGFTGLFRDRADLVFEQSVPLTSLWPDFSLERVSNAATPSRKLNALELQLRERLADPPPCSLVVKRALSFLHGPNATVRTCAEFAGLSERRLSQLFREQVGLSPKVWFRLQRFQSALADLHRGVDIAWADLALRSGYYDQSHFINDFRAFSGLNPTTYCSSRGPWKNHVPIA